MKFELVEPAEPLEAPESAAGAAAGSSAEPTVPTAPVLGANEVLAARMRDRSEELGTRLTRIIEAVRPALHRMEAGIVRAERELADSGHGFAAAPPDSFRADRFTGAAAPTASAPTPATVPAVVAPTPVTSEENGSR
ncbi:hypothetical protein [Nocardiopsis synnemataformans]|uniref:hypothetical protein n=1 Tax=Nocardiopsis synnemataformans TaxID=61305 RepID=UPI003EBE527E